MLKHLLPVVLVFSITSSIAQNSAKGLKLNDTAPGFTARDQNGKMISLQDQLKKGPVVLIFYRGYWCPWCNKFLQQLEDSLLQITTKEGNLIAVTAEQPENISRTIEKTRASYPILFDKGLTIMKSYDVAFAVDEKTVEQYKKYGIDFNKVNGSENGTRLPVPAVYIINKERKIVYRHLDPDYTKRPAVREILDNIP